VAVHPLIAFWRNEAKFLSDSNRSNGIREQIPSLDFLPNWFGSDLFGAISLFFSLFAGVDPERGYPGNLWRTLPISAHGSALRYFFQLSTVNWLPARVRASASHETGIEIGAPARARVE
jgi:hypothetical protein